MGILDRFALLAEKGLLRRGGDSTPVSLGLTKKAGGAPKSAGTPAPDLETLCHQVGMSKDAVVLARQPTDSASRADPKRKAALLRLLDACEKALGKDHASTALVLEHLGQSVVTLAEAEPLVLRCLAIRERQLGLEHADTIEARSLLANLFKLTKRYDESIELFERNRAILETRAGENDLQLGIMLSNLAGLYRLTGEFQKAEQCWRQLLDRSESRHGIDYPDTAWVAFQLAMFLYNTGRYSESMTILQQVLKTYTSTGNTADPRIMQVKEKITELEPLLAGRAETEQWPSLQVWPFKTVTDPVTGITLRLPAAWELAPPQLAGTSAYGDVRTPQYNFLISSSHHEPHADFASQSALEMLNSLLRLNPFAHSVECHAVGSTRAVAYYCSTVPDPADREGRKDDRGWVVLDKSADRATQATITLSVLADHARKEETDALARRLTAEMDSLQLRADTSQREPPFAIALSLAEIALNEFKRFHAEVNLAAGDQAPLDPARTLFHVLAATAHAFRQKTSTPGEIGAIEEVLWQHAIGTVLTPDQEAMKKHLINRYRADWESYIGNFVTLMRAGEGLSQPKTGGKNNAEMLTVGIMTKFVVQLIGPGVDVRALLRHPERLMRLSQCLFASFVRVLSLVGELQSKSIPQ